jgi:hypothetical protein
MGQAIEAHTPTTLTRATFKLHARLRLSVLFDAGSVVERKPLASTRLSQSCPPGTENALLVLKTRNLAAMQTSRDRDHWRQVTEIAAADNRIRLIDHTMTSAELTGLLASCDCYISLHRSEGFGYGPADAMGLGKPVITTAYSGVTDFCNSETALPIDYELSQSLRALTRIWMRPASTIGHRPTLTPRLSRCAGFMKSRNRVRLGQRRQQLIRKSTVWKGSERRYVGRLAELGWL